MSETMTIFLTGLTIGVLITAAYAVMQAVHAERRHRDEMALLRRSFDPELQNLPDVKAPIQFGNPPPGVNTEWIKHTPHHWTCLLCGDKLQYWPTKGKWMWRGTVYEPGDGDTVELFMQRRTREYYG